LKLSLKSIEIIVVKNIHYFPSCVPETVRHPPGLYKKSDATRPSRRALYLLALDRSTSDSPTTCLTLLPQATDFVLRQRWDHRACLLSWTLCCCGLTANSHTFLRGSHS